ncbi:MAG TPA: hypothetical protein ENF94_01970 [Candidatus Woesearchaeota archaeon]|nr:hypothetical protein [Candidatus Woesearchaeota archaeon]
MDNNKKLSDLGKIVDKENLDYNKDVCVEHGGIFALDYSRNHGPVTRYVFLCPFPGECEYKHQEKLDDGRLGDAYCRLIYEKLSDVLGISFPAKKN